MVQNFPKVSVIIVNTNELRHLKICLPSLFQQNYPNYEVLVIDNVSTDGSLEYIAQSFPQVTIIRNQKNLGYAGANNAGFKNATGEYLVVLNPDTRVESDWLRELVMHLQSNPQAGLATPKILMMNDPDILNTCGNEITYTGLTFCRGLGKPAAEYSQSEIVSAVSGAAFMIKREVLEQIGGFDETFFIYYEETDLCLRAMLAGYVCLYVPTSVIYHLYSFKFSPNKAFYQERNRYYALLKTLRWRTLLILLPTLILAEILAWGYAVTKGPKNIQSKIRSYTWIIGHHKQILQARGQTQLLRQVPDKEIVKRFGYHMGFAHTSLPWLEKFLEKIFNPLVFLLGRVSYFIINW